MKTKACKSGGCFTCIRVDIVVINLTINFIDPFTEVTINH